MPQGAGGRQLLLCVCKSENKDFKRDYAKENMGQCESKNQNFKE
jgi:hypothetical protein